MITELRGSLFESKTSLAHCVSQDFNMGMGIASQFKERYGRVDELLYQKKVVGDVAVIQEEKKYIYYLVTKKSYYGKPTYSSLRKSLESMKHHMLKNKVNDVSIPRIGCGLDRLKWDKVLNMLTDIFDGLNITVYSL